MSELETSSAYDVKIESVLISSDRLEKDYEIVANVSEINIFENLDLPYMTGSILVTDSTELNTLIKFQGTEKVKIVAKINGDDTAKSVEKRFVVTDIKVVPAQDTSEVILLNIIEEHAYLSRLITVSKAYDGKPEIILAKIIKDNLKKEIFVPKEFTGSVVQPMKVVVPSMTPLDAARWIKDRIVEENGMPFFFYSTLNGPKLFLTDLSFMLLEPPKNENRPYSYGQAFNRWSTSHSVYEQARNIESYKLPKAENMYGLASNGVLNSTYEFLDTVRGKSVSEMQLKVNMSDVLDGMEAAGLITPDQRGPIYDDEFTLEDRKISEYNPSLMSQITTSDTFESFVNYYEAETKETHKLKAVSRALRYYLLKSPIEITMPGFEFMGRGENTTIGTQVYLNFLKNNPDILQTDVEALDKRRSGKYLIYACRHVIRPEKYSVSLMCVKLANQKS